MTDLVRSLAEYLEYMISVTVDMLLSFLSKRFDEKRCKYATVYWPQIGQSRVTINRNLICFVGFSSVS